MPGRFESRIWQSDETRNAPPRHRRACRYEVHLPDHLGDLEVRLDGELAALVSEAEQALITLNSDGGSALTPLARLLLRSESIASSKVEGMQLGVRELARAEAKAESGSVPGTTALEVLANIDAMVLPSRAPPRVSALRKTRSERFIAACSSVPRIVISPARSVARKIGSAATTTPRAGRILFLLHRNC